METFVVVLLCVAVVWLAVRQDSGAESRTRIDELIEMVRRLEQRIGLLERAKTAQNASALEATYVTGAPVAAPVAAPGVEMPKQEVAEPTPSVRVVSPMAGITELRAHQSSLPAKTSPPPPEPEAVSDFLAKTESPVPESTPDVPPPPQAAALAEPSRAISLEERLGQNWLNKLGITSIVLGVAIGLGYQLPRLGPLGKTLFGFALSLLLLLGGVWLERLEKYRLFARAGIGGGWALLFFVTYAMYHLDAMRVVSSQGLDLMLMLLVAAAMVGHSLRYRSEAVTALAFLLAFATVGISQVTLFSLVAGALLAASLVVIVARERWYALGLAGLLGVYGNHFLWLLRVLPDGAQPGVVFPEFFASAGLLLGYWVIFRLLFVLREPLDENQRMLSSFMAVGDSAGLLLLLKYQSAHPEWAFWGLLALGVAEWVFAFVGRGRWRGSFVVLSTIASSMLLAAIPFRFSGAPWSMLWLLEGAALVVAGTRLPEPVLRRLGVLASYAAAIQILAVEVLPLGESRGSGVAVAATITCLSAALVLWLQGEVAPRVLPDLVAEPFDQATAVISSYAAAGMFTLGLWALAPGSWTVVAWIAAALALGLLASRFGSADFATQADLLTVLALLRIVVVNFNDTTHTGSLSTRALTVGTSALLLYCGTGRKQNSHFLEGQVVSGSYSLAATSLLTVLAWYELPIEDVAFAWGILGLILFEVGIKIPQFWLRLQAYGLFLAMLPILLLNDLASNDACDGQPPTLLAILPVLAGYLWVYERSRRKLPESRMDVAAGIGAAWGGLVLTAALLQQEVPRDYNRLAFAGLAAVMLYTAWILRRRLFTAQALAVLGVLTMLLFEDLSFHFEKPGTPFLWTLWFRIGSAGAVMLLTLPAAFGLRRSGKNSPSKFPILDHTEQPFFFAPLTLIALLLSQELHGGSITISWIALGLAAFLFALPVGERSYRLGGLGLLLLGLGKIYVVDVWSTSWTDRVVTLVVSGAALMLVSFLYTRYKETILKFL
jgi:hypothetical protein